MLKLPILPLTDFSKICHFDKVKIEIINTTYKFSPDSQFSGLDERQHPIFGSNVFINDKLIYEFPYGLPSLLFPKGSTPLINFINNTKFTTNLHFHGLINTGLIDGASSLAVFGNSTSLGISKNFQFPIIRNNSALTWYHSHAMFRSVELACSGMVGSVLITDELSDKLNDFFIYEDNYFVLTLLDADFDTNGCLVLENLPVDINRSSFTVVNGISTVQWYTEPNIRVPFSNILEHNTNINLVKIDIINFGSNWRVYYIGVCDINKNILPFYVIQTDQGLCEPTKTTMQFIPVAGRISILIDLSIINNAYIFFYDFDLTENLGINDDGTAVFPDFNNPSSTVYPTPISDPDNINQQSIETRLNYPNVQLISQVNLPMINGNCPIPDNKIIRPFLYLHKKDDNNHNDINEILNVIKNIIYKNSHLSFDINNYITNLNPKYYYNLPKVTNNTPNRNFVLWGETDINYVNGTIINPYISDISGNINGISECCLGANRIMVDLWNSNELDIDFALTEYKKSPNNYKPSKLPTSDFRITKKNDKYINIAMISNDEFIIELFDNNIKYGDMISVPISKIKIVLSPTEQDKDLNLNEWINLLNTTLKNKNIKINQNYIKLSKLLNFDWSFFPYAVNLLDGTIQYIKTAIIKITNKSNYCIRLKGRWAILQMMGKCMIGNKNFVPPTPGAGPCCSVDSPCDEELLYGVYDNYIQSWYPYYATESENVQNPILCPRRDAELIINSLKTYIGFYDGFVNDNIRSFSAKLRSTEIWSYLNADTGDSHPLHFHLTSGFLYKNLSNINELLDNPGNIETPGLTHTFSRDIYQIGPPKKISFALTWPFYASEDTTITPYIPNIGAPIHCHFLPHNDTNSMIITYAVKEEEFFGKYHNY